MTFAQKEISRYKAAPTKLFLFKGADPTMESLMRSVTIIPGATEFGIGTTLVTSGGVPKNFYAAQSGSDFESSLDDLISVAPHLKHVSLVVAWHGTDLRCGECEIRPKVEIGSLPTSPYQWQVGNVTRGAAQVVSQIEGKPAYGGAPADRSVFEAIAALKSRGLMVTLYPFVMMDIPAANSLPSPYGGNSQPSYPWRGRITCHPASGQAGSVDGSNAAAVQVANFFGSAAVSNFSWNAAELRVNYSGPDSWRFERFVLHMATIAAAAGADDILLCGELVNLTRVRGAGGTYPAVSAMTALAAKVRAIVGPSVKISYAADWSEFHSHQISGDLRFYLDPLWANENIDYVGIDNYFPLADWRDGFSHADWLAGHTSMHDLFYLQQNIEGGELFDWFYASESDRANQIRTPITDGAYGEPWVFRQKDIRSWWSNEHHDRLAGSRQASPTAWVPQSKPIVFTELGCAAVDKGANQPNVFLDPKSSESHSPHFSNGRPDAAAQRAFLEASLDYWRPDGSNNNGMIDFDRISIWTWDARPYPVFPIEADLFGDAGNWITGHWITGRAEAGRAFEHGQFGPYAYTNAEHPITRAGITYEPWPIKHGEITTTGSMDKSDIAVTMATGSGFESEFIGYPPSQVINLTIFQGHMDDTPSLVDFPAQWLGRVSVPEYSDNEVTLQCVPVSSSIRRPGLRRNYQLGCPHVLYGPSCQASKSAATVARTVLSIVRNRITLNAPLGGGGIVPANYGGGLIEWVVSGGRREVRTIAKVSEDGNEVTVRGTLRGLSVESNLEVVLGCPRTTEACGGLHNNILNFGGQPFIPLENPLSQKNQFY